MTIVRLFAGLFLLSANAGCATLPDVSKVINETPAAQQPRRLVSSKGLLSHEKSQEIGRASCRERVYHPV